MSLRHLGVFAPLALFCTRCMDRRLVQADELERSGRAWRQLDRVVEAVRTTPGLTSGELAARHGLDRHMVARRLPEAARVGLITRREIGAQEVTWWPR